MHGWLCDLKLTEISRSVGRGRRASPSRQDRASGSLGGTPPGYRWPRELQPSKCGAPRHLRQCVQCVPTKTTILTTTMVSATAACTRTPLAPRANGWQPAARAMSTRVLRAPDLARARWTRSLLSDAVDVDLHPIGIILKSNALKGIRFEISKDHWQGTRAYGSLPEKVVGCMVRPAAACTLTLTSRSHALVRCLRDSSHGVLTQDSWVGAKSNDKVLIQWESDGKNSQEWLSVLLRARLELKLLPRADGHMPAAKGAEMRRRYATATTTGPYARRGGAATAQVDVEQITVPKLSRPSNFPPQTPRAAHLHTHEPPPHPDAPRVSRASVPDPLGDRYGSRVRTAQHIARHHPSMPDPLGDRYGYHPSSPAHTRHHLPPPMACIYTQTHRCASASKLTVVLRAGRGECPLRSLST